MNKNKKNKNVVIIDEVPSGPAAAGLLTELQTTGLLSQSNWKQIGRYNDYRTQFVVKEARKILADWSEETIKQTWLNVERICDNWRIKNKLTLHSNQKSLPVQFHIGDQEANAFRLSRDAECFNYMLLKQYPPAISLFENIGYKRFLATTILYEDHFGFVDDALASYASLKEIEEQEAIPDIERGQKVLQGSRLGHEHVYGNAEKKKSRWDEYQRYVEDLHNKQPSLNWTTIQKKAAKEFQVCTKTIRRNTTNPTKKS